MILKYKIFLLFFILTSVNVGVLCQNTPLLVEKYPIRYKPLTSDDTPYEPTDRLKQQINIHTTINIIETLNNDRYAGVQVGLGYQIIPIKNKSFLQLEGKVGMFLERYESQDWHIAANDNYFRYTLQTGHISLSPKVRFEVLNNLYFVAYNDFGVSYPLFGSIREANGRTTGFTNKRLMFIYGAGMGVQLGAGRINWTFILGYNSYNSQATVQRNTPSDVPKLDSSVWAGLVIGGMLH